MVDGTNISLSAEFFKLKIRQLRAVGLIKRSTGLMWLNHLNM